MSKVTTKVDVTVVMELSLEEAQHVREVFGARPGNGIDWAIFSPLYEALKLIPSITRGVE